MPNPYYSYIVLGGSLLPKDDAYGGEVHKDTLDKFSSDLEALAEIHGLRWLGEVEGRRPNAVPLIDLTPRPVKPDPPMKPNQCAATHPEHKTLQCLRIEHSSGGHTFEFPFAHVVICMIDGECLDCCDHKDAPRRGAVTDTPKARETANLPMVWGNPTPQWVENVAKAQADMPKGTGADKWVRQGSKYRLHMHQHTHTDYLVPDVKEVSHGHWHAHDTDEPNITYHSGLHRDFGVADTPGDVRIEHDEAPFDKGESRIRAIVAGHQLVASPKGEEVKGVDKTDEELLAKHAEVCAACQNCKECRASVPHSHLTPVTEKHNQHRPYSNEIEVINAERTNARG